MKARTVRVMSGVGVRDERGGVMFDGHAAWWRGWLHGTVVRSTVEHAHR